MKSFSKLVSSKKTNNETWKKDSFEEENIKDIKDNKIKNDSNENNDINNINNKKEQKNKI